MRHICCSELRDTDICLLSRDRRPYYLCLWRSRNSDILYFINVIKCQRERCLYSQNRILHNNKNRDQTRMTRVEVFAFTYLVLAYFIFYHSSWSTDLFEFKLHYVTDLLTIRGEASEDEGDFVVVHFDQWDTVSLLLSLSSPLCLSLQSFRSELLKSCLFITDLHWCCWFCPWWVRYTKPYIPYIW